ncbi:hypothetical protein [Cellvibrio sp. ARAG 10.3]|uniref:hypothetical protein n=1 Tax=Cellvibrio sp. ARAG 10.3 TaxID=3451358 RepID=UPI003F6E2BC2
MDVMKFDHVSLNPSWNHGLAPSLNSFSENHPQNGQVFTEINKLVTSVIYPSGSLHGALAACYEIRSNKWPFGFTRYKNFFNLPEAVECLSERRMRRATDMRKIIILAPGRSILSIKKINRD